MGLAARLARNAFQRLLPALICALILTATARSALAHSNGEAAQGCGGCHSGGAVPTVSLVADSALVALGQTLTLTLSISDTNGPVAGFFMQTNGGGSFKIVDTGTKLVGPGVTHTQPRAGTGGQTRFTVAWTAPTQPGGVDFYVWANSANGDGKSSGDGEGTAFLSMAIGCGAGNKYYRDADGDGVGAVSSGYTQNCSAPQYYSAMPGDCNDNDPNVYPGAPEVCNGKDDNCDGQIDENLAISTYCVDKDGDGHGVSGAATAMGCAPPKGFGLCDEDCNDNDPTIYPSAPELCNNRDDNCNGRVDEGARVTCGVGWCARYGEGCSSTVCTPGPPRAEQCNAFDDDCDGVADNGTDLALCGKPGLHCLAGTCVVDANAGGSVPGVLAPLNPPATTVGGSSTDGSTTGGGSSPPAAACALRPGEPATGRTPLGWVTFLVGLVWVARRKRSLRLLGCSILWAACSSHAPKEQPDASPARAAKAKASAEPADSSAQAALEIKYTFSAPSSQIVFVARDAQGKHEGSFGKFSGSITVKNGSPEQGSVTVDIDMTSVQAGDPKLTRALKSPGFLDVDKFPAAHFVSQSVRSGGDLAATNTVTGTLELHGVRKSIDIPATLHVRANGVDVDAEVSLKRKDFGLGLTGKRAARIEDEVVLQLLVVAVPTP